MDVVRFEQCPFCHVGNLRLSICDRCVVALPTWQEKKVEPATKEDLRMLDSLGDDDDPDQTRRMLCSPEYDLALAWLGEVVKEVKELGQASSLSPAQLSRRDSLIRWLTGQPFGWQRFKEIINGNDEQPYTLSFVCHFSGLNESAVRSSLLKQLTPALFVPPRFRLPQFTARIICDTQLRLYRLEIKYKGKTWEATRVGSYQHAIRFLKVAKREIEAHERGERRKRNEQRRTQKQNGVEQFGTSHTSVSSPMWSETSTPGQRESRSSSAISPRTRPQGKST